MAASNQLYANAVELDITPPVGTAFDGYAARSGCSIGIHDPLLGQLFMLKSGRKQVVIITMDMLGTSLDFTRQVRAGIAKAIDVAPDHILIACSHTHSGAAGFLPPHPGITSFTDLELQKNVANKLVGAATWAKQGLQPARLGVGRGYAAGIGLNRNDPENGPVDNQVTVVSVQTKQGQPLAVIMNHGCHPTVLGFQNLFFSADYPGATRSTLKQIYPDTIFIFTNGASGDVSTRFTRHDQTFHEVERMGRILAGEVLKVMQSISPWPSIEIDSMVAPVELKFRTFPDPVAAQHEIKVLQAELNALRAANAPHGDIRRAITRVEGATGQAMMAQELAGKTANHSQVQVIVLGELALVGLPGEPFTRTVLDIKSRSPKPITAVVSYANDYEEYFPDAKAIEEGNYEALISPYTADVPTVLTETALRLLRNE